MHKLTTLLAAVALSLGAFAEIAQYPIPNGAAKAPYAAKLVGVVANSSVSDGTISVKEVVSVASSSDAYVVTTNIINAGADYLVADAYVGQQRVYADGSIATKWLKSDTIVTNIEDAVTNVVTYHLAKWCDGATTNAVVWTNCAHSIKYRDVIATAPVTNIVRTNYKVWTHTPFTNVLYTGTLSDGSLSDGITNRFILGGSTLLGDGTVFSTSGARTSAFFILEK